MFPNFQTLTTVSATTIAPALATQLKLMSAIQNGFMMLKLEVALLASLNVAIRTLVLKKPAWALQWNQTAPTICSATFHLTAGRKRWYYAVSWKIRTCTMKPLSHASLIARPPAILPTARTAINSIAARRRELNSRITIIHVRPDFTSMASDACQK